MRLTVAIGVMRLMYSEIDKHMATLGFQPAEVELLTGDHPWIGSDRQNVMRLLESATFSTMDHLGLPRIEVCAEFLAANIFVFVSPTNYMSACAWSARTQSVDKSSAREFDPITAQELHAYLVQLMDTDANAFSYSFQKSVAAKIKAAKPKE
ncbi:external scaffolding protein [Microviridae sp.]|nr:external scaffolding protein [Microviridae sp.]